MSENEKNQNGKWIKNLKRKLFYSIISNLPTALRHSFYRKKYAIVPTEIAEGLTFELARTQEDLEAAFKLLHDAYVEQNFITPQPSGMRLIVQHALPSTSILIAKKDGIVVGTISVMRDTKLGLPMEKVFDLSHLKLKGRRVAELSCLAIHPDFRRKMGGDIFFPLTVFAAMFSYKFLGTDSLMFNLFPHHADFYNAIFGSTHLEDGASKDYLGAPATAIQLDIESSFVFGKKYYAGLGPKRDLLDYVFFREHPYFKYPKKDTGVINYPVMTPKIFKYFFVEKTDLIKNITDLEEQVLAQYYPLDSFETIIPLGRYRAKREEQRWDVQITGECKCPESNQLTPVLLLDISMQGFRAHLNGPIAPDKVHNFQVKLKDGSLVEVAAKFEWKTEDNIFGFCIITANADWFKLVETQARALLDIAS